MSARLLLPILGLFALLATAPALPAGAEEPPADQAPEMRQVKPGPLSEAEDAALKTSFDAFRIALQDEDYDSAAALVSPSSWPVLASIRNAALYASAEEVKSLAIADQILVLRLRLTHDAETLKAAHGRQLAALALGAGLFGRQGVETIQLGPTRGLGWTAEALMMKADGKPSSVSLIFERVDNIWRLNLLPVLDMARFSYERLRAAEDTARTAFVIETLEGALGRKVPDTAWQPLAER
ncbi:hypothetical protein [Roseospirillum parvum]|uniref:Phospholipid transport system substrate-binding protein n=1 Tax=Roseospirillum parvum TaxID=83401 RepID=A0A1G7YGG0_9PROT|nr:hypothetical protein [Roseospirillum parvum]SDG95456.1 hypothetical protein SAMN05421742_103295 [Roseospirillum parvum]